MHSDSETSATGGEEKALQQLLLFVTQSMADHPTEVEVQFISDEDGEAFEIRANPEDLGRIIGKNGQTARALQLIVNANARKTGRRYQLDIVGTDEDLDEE